MAVINKTMKKLCVPCGNDTKEYEITDAQAREDITTLQETVAGKADKVVPAVSGNFAGLDSNGDLTDSGKKAADFATPSDLSTGLAGKVDKVDGKGLSTNDYTDADKAKVASAITDVSGKADKVASATSGNFAGLDSNGNLTDSGHKHSDYLTEHQDISGKADKVSSATNGNFAGLNSSGNLTDSGSKASDFATAASVGTVPTGKTVQGQITELKSAIDVLEPFRMDVLNAIGGYTDPVDMSSGITSGEYILTGYSVGHEVSLSPVPESGWSYIILACKEGDKFSVTGTSGNSPRLWCLIDNDNIIKRVAGANASSGSITVESGEVKLICNFSTSASKSITKSTQEVTDTNLVTRMGTVEAEVLLQNSKIAEISVPVSQIKYTDLSSEIVSGGGLINTGKSEGQTVYLTPEADPEWSYAICDCEAGDTFVIGGTSGNTPRLWCFIDKDNKVLGNPAVSSITSDNPTAPTNTVKIVCNFKTSDSKTLKKGTTSIVSESLPDKNDLLDSYKKLIEEQTGVKQYDGTFSRKSYSYQGTLINAVNSVHTEYVSSDIIGVELSDIRYGYKITKFTKLDVFSESEIYARAKPFYNFDHETYNYVINIEKRDGTFISDDEARNAITLYTKNVKSEEILNRSIGINDMTRLLSGDGPQVAYDKETGFCYVLYNAGETEYGEGYYLVEMAAFPIGQPTKITYYTAVKAGETYGSLTFTQTRDTNLLMMDDAIRFYFYEVETAKVWYRDFSKSEKAFGDAHPVQFKQNSESTATDMSVSAMQAYYTEIGKSYSSADFPVEFCCNIVKVNNMYYSVVTFGISSYPTIVSSSDAETWTAITTPNITLQYEAALAYCDGWYLICRNNGVYYFADGTFASFTQIGNHVFDEYSTRPEIIEYGDKVIMGLSQNGVFPTDGIAAGERKYITLLKGKGTAITDYEPLLTIINPNGICYFRFLDFNGILYLITTLGDLFPDHHGSGGVTCKDGVYLIRLGRI